MRARASLRLGPCSYGMSCGPALSELGRPCWLSPQGIDRRSMGLGGQLVLKSSNAREQGEMSTKRLFYTLLVLGIPIGTLAQDAAVPPQPLSLDGAATHVYKSVDGIDLRLHVFTPANHRASEPRPAIVFFF